MPSIRRSLTVYLLLLVGGGLAVVAAVTDELVGRTLDARRAAEAARAGANFDEQCRRDREELDKSLLVEARDTFIRVRDRSAEQVRERSQQFAALLVANDVAAGPFPLARLAWVGDASRPGDHRGPATFLAGQYVFSRGVGPLADDGPPGDPHPPLYQISLAGRADTVWRSPALGATSFPPVASSPQRAADVDWTAPDTLSLNGHEVRWLTFKAPLAGPFAFRTGGRGGRAPPAGPPGPPPGPRPERAGPPTPRVYIQYAKPLAGLDDDTARHQQEMTDGLAALEAGIAHDRAALRLSLATVAGVTFLGILVGGPLLVRRGLRPVDKLTDAVGRVNERDFRLPVEAREVGRELLPIHDRLTHTLAALRRAFEREKDAVADISHELRTPVAGLQATIDVALRKPRTADQYRTTLEECRGITRQLGRLVERVLTLARLDADVVSKAVPTDLADLTAGCVAVVRPLAEAHGLTVTADLHPGLSAVTDPDQVREVVMNLLSNAVEYNSPGGSVGVTAKASGGAAVIEVRDTGIGMSAEVADRIFERFYRADPARHATGAHAGLGLAIVREAVAKLGGTVAVESAPGQGSTFRVTLPA